MRNDLRDLDRLIAEKKEQNILTLMSKEKLDKRKEEEQKNYEENVLPRILKLTKERDRIYFNQGKKTKKYKRKQKEIDKIIKETPSPWKEMANKRRRVQELFNNIEHDLATLSYWEGKNPWILLSIRAEEAVIVGFARYATTKEIKLIKKGKFKGQWIRFQSKANNDWRTIVPEVKSSSVSRALFFTLHKLRIACREKAQE